MVKDPSQPATQNNPSEELTFEPASPAVDQDMATASPVEEAKRPAALIKQPGRPGRRLRPLEIGIFTAGIAAMAVAVIVGTAPDRASANKAQIAAKSKQPKQPKRMTEFAMPTCQGNTTNAQPGKDTGDPRARQSAQKGLDYLAQAAQQWQEQNRCYGCHVQAVTVEALAVGVHHQYTVAEASRNAVLSGMLDLPGGARTSGGLGHPSPTIAQTGKLLGGAAFARWDQWVDDSLRDFMLAEAKAILAMQSQDGQVPMPFTSAPVATGPIQATAHAVVAWKQAYERTADDQWLTAISKAEDHLHSVVSGWKAQPTTSIQDMNYAIMGLLAAGVSSSEQVMVELDRMLAGLQNEDGGWSLFKGSASEPFATGQTLYVLRLMGHGDTDPVVARGTSWLIEHQQADGSWSHAGFGKAEAMWAVLGLVSLDVLSVSVAGIQNGQHVEGTLAIAVEAKDNKGGSVERVEVFVDDIRAYGACSATLTYQWDTAGLQDGKHVIEVRAQNARGDMSRRYVEVYAGNVYLTQIGTRFSGNGTEIALRNLAANDTGNRVKVEIYAGVEKDGRVTAGNKLHSMEEAGRQGAMSFQWKGEGADAQAAMGQKYIAKLTFADKNGQPVQTEEVVFVHDTPEAQRANWAELEGALDLPGGDAAQNAMVELVDEKGQVVQRTVSTREGKFRFKGVKAKDGYQVRVKKEGFSAAAPAQAEQGKASAVDLTLQAQ